MNAEVFFIVFTAIFVGPTARQRCHIISFFFADSWMDWLKQKFSLNSFLFIDVAAVNHHKNSAMCVRLYFLTGVVKCTSIGM